LNLRLATARFATDAFACLGKSSWAGYSFQEERLGRQCQIPTSVRVWRHVFAAILASRYEEGNPILAADVVGYSRLARKIVRS
jgi:hypothetical protein